MSKTKEMKKHTEEWARQLLDDAVTSGQQIFPCVVRHVIEECQSEEDESCRKAVFKFCVEVSNKEQVNTQVVKEVLGKLLHEVDSLKGSSLIEVAELIIKGVKEGSTHALELFPKILSVISSHKIISYHKEGGSNGEVEGPVQKSYLLNSLCGCRWEPSCVLSIADMCKDISMTSEELEFLIQKLLRVMKDMSLPELPPLVYQLLILSNKGHKSLVLEGIQALFNQLDHEILKNQGEHIECVVAANSGEEELLQTEGIVILHISFALKQGQELRREYFKSLDVVQTRLSSCVVTPFFVALSLSVARMHRFETEIFKFLKEVVINSFKGEERKKTSKWMQEVCEDLPDMDSLLMDIVEHSTCGWDHVLQGLVMLGFNLMGTLASKSTGPIVGTPQHRACCLGSRLLLKTFKVHQVVQEEIVSHTVNHILSNATGHVEHYISLLGSIISSCPLVAAEPPPQLKDSLSFLNLLPPPSAIDLLRSLLPMIQYSGAVRDSLLLVLRKLLFSRHIDSRKIAVGGYVVLLKEFMILESINSTSSQSSQATHSTCSSQVTVEVHDGSSTTNGPLCFEILGTLRRSLTKQSDVRLSLYEGLYPVFCANSSLAEAIMGILVGHFQTYYIKEQSITPIKLELCVSTSGSDVVQVEPLDGLVRCLQLCVTKFSEWEETNADYREVPAVTEAQDILQSLVERMGKCEPEDFELDKSSDFTATSSVGQKNKGFAKILMGVYEALLEYTFAIGEFSQESCDQTLKLFQGYYRISMIIQEMSSQSGFSSSKRGLGNDSNLSLQCVVRLLRALFSDSCPNHQQPLSVLRESSQFVSYVVNATLRKIHQFHEGRPCDGAGTDATVNTTFQLCCDLGKILFKQVETGHSGPAKKDKGKSNSLLCLDGFNQLTLMMTTVFKPPADLNTRTDTLHEFLVSAVPSLRGKDRNEGICHFIRFFEVLIVNVLSGCQKEWSMRDLQLMINAINFLSKELDTESVELKETFDWAYTQCKDQNIDDGPVTKSLCSLMMTLNARYKGSIKTVGKLAKDVHYHLGDIDEEVELEGETSFAIVNPRTAASSILGLIYTHIDTILGDTDWLINRLKSEIASSPAEHIFEGQRSSVETQASDYCSSVCDRLVYVVSSCSELVQTNIPSGPTVDGMFKVVTKLFSVLGNLTKYNLSVYAKTCSVLPSFERLISLVGKELSQQVYSSIFLYTSVTDGESHSDKSKKGPRKKGKSSQAGKVNIRREIRSVPNLIFAMEKLEKFLIKLGKKAKVNLMESFKRSTARDFRINTQLINVQEEDGDGVDSSPERDEDPPKAKRMKINEH